MLDILKPEEQLTTEFVITTVVAFLFCRQLHSSFLACIHFEEIGESLLRRFSAHCGHNPDGTTVQQSFDLFLTLPPIQPGQKVLRGVLTGRSVQMFSTNVKHFIWSAHTEVMPMCVPIPDQGCGEKTRCCARSVTA